MGYDEINTFLQSYIYNCYFEGNQNADLVWDGIEFNTPGEQKHASFCALKENSSNLKRLTAKSVDYSSIILQKINCDFELQNYFLH